MMRTLGGRWDTVRRGGAAAGLALALAAAVDVARIPTGAVALVNGIAVGDPGGADPRRVEFAIDRELLVQRGLAIDAPRADRRVRGRLVSAQIDAIVQQGRSTGAPGTAEQLLASWLRAQVANTPIVIAPDLAATWDAGTYGVRPAAGPRAQR